MHSTRLLRLICGRTILAWSSLAASSACGRGESEELSDEDVQEVMFDESGVGRVDLSISKADLDFLNADPEAESYVEADFTYTSPDGGYEKAVDRVGVRYKGNRSLDARLPKLPWKVKFNNYVSGQKFAGLKKIGFGTEYGDPTFIREALAYSVARRAGVLAPRTQYVRIFVNDEDRGLYLMTEEEDDVFLGRHFGDGEGNLYKVTRGPLLYWGDNADDYTGANGSYEYDEGSEVDPTFEDLITLAQTLCQSTDEELETGLTSALDVEAWLDLLAVNTLQVNLDAPTYTANNYYLYNDPDVDRFVVLGWDMDSSFGAFPPTATPQEKVELDIYNPKLTTDPRPLVDRVLGNPKWQSMWLERLREIRHAAFDPDALEVEALAFAALIKPELETDEFLIYGADAAAKALYADSDASDIVRLYPQPFPALVPFIRARAASVDAQLDSGERTWPTSERLVPIVAVFDVTVAAPTADGDLYIYAQGDIAGELETYLVRKTVSDLSVKFNTMLSVPAALVDVQVAAFLDVDGDEWIDPNVDYFGAVEIAIDSAAIDAALVVDSPWSGDPIWASKFGAPTGL